MRKNLIPMLILIPLTIGIGESMADEPDSLGVHVDTVWLECDYDSLNQIPIKCPAYMVDAAVESLIIIDNVLIECANGANYPSNGGVLEEGE